MADTVQLSRWPSYDNVTIVSYREHESSSSPATSSPDHDRRKLKSAGGARGAGDHLGAGVLRRDDGEVPDGPSAGVRAARPATRPERVPTRLLDPGRRTRLDVPARQRGERRGQHL